MKTVQEQRRSFALSRQVDVEKTATAAPSHETAVANLAQDAEFMNAVEQALAGTVVTEEQKHAGVGVLELSVSRRCHTYKVDEALFHRDPPSRSGEADWVSLRGNTSLKYLLNKHGGNLLVYESHRETVTFEFLIFELYKTNRNSVRVLLRRKSD